MEADSPSPLNELNIQILRLLEENARRSCREIAEKLGVATGTVYNRIKKMTENGVIRGYTPIIDPSKVGYNLTALVFAQVEGQYLTDVERKIAGLPGVMAVYDITGEHDVAIVVRSKDRASLDAFLKDMLKIPHVRRSVTNVVLNVVKEDFRISL
ncbi:MAG: Lrp/AsnC family transcriptional regulator [Candidatus Bathyarchaeia archaeon]